MRHGWARLAGGVTCALFAASVAVAQEPTTFEYDFTDGSDGWQLDDNWALGSWEVGGAALVGHVHGIARHVEATGVLRTASLRFQMDAALAFFCLRFGDVEPPPGTVYTVCFEALAASVTRNQDGTDTELAFVPFSIEGGMPHTATVHTGGGSIDLFIDGVPVAGVDAADPSPGPLVLMAGPKQVTVDDVKIVLGGDGAAHPHAPRPVADVAPGPDVGPFVDGEVTGDVTLSGDDVLELSGGRYTVLDGNIEVTDDATLVVASDGLLAFGVASSPLLHWGVRVSGNGRFQIDGGRLETQGQGGLIVIDAHENAAVELRDCQPWVHIVQAEGDSSVVLDGVRLVTSIGGQIALGGSTTVDVRRSVLASISLDLPAGSTFRAEGLEWNGHVADFDLRRDLDIDGIGYQLTMTDVALQPTVMGDGANEKGWLLAADRNAIIELVSSELGKLNLGIPEGDNDDLTIRGLRLGTPVDFSFGSIDFDDVTMTQQWGFFINGSRNVVFDDSEGVWLFLFDAVDALLRDSEMSEFDPRDYTGTVTFDDATWLSAACEIIENNDFVIRGSVTTTDSLRNCSWSDSAVDREFEVTLRDGNGRLVADAELTVSRDDSSFTVTTDASGTAKVTLTFDDEDRLSPWTITGPGDAEATVHAFSSSPVRLATSDPPRVRRGVTRRIP